MVIYSYPCKIRPIPLLHRMNTRLSHGYSMLGVAAKERNILYLDNICCYVAGGGRGMGGWNMGDFIRECVCFQQISWVCQLNRVHYELLVPA